MKIFETHAHYDDKAFDVDRAPLLSSMEAHGVGPLINVGATLGGAKASLALAREYPFVYAAIGVHPSDIETLRRDWTPEEEDGEETADGGAREGTEAPGTEGYKGSVREEPKGPETEGTGREEARDAAREEPGWEEPYEWGLSWIAENAADPRVVAIGEIGLDYYWEKDGAVRKRQRHFFKRQLALAREARLPVIIHSRDACEDTLSILREAVAAGTEGVMHCFSYSPEVAEEYVRLGFYIGVGGVATFKNAKKLKEAVARVPLSRILLETDCPYMAPHPFRGGRNDSTYLPYVAQAVAKIRGIPEEQVVEATARNARELFKKAEST